MKNLFWSLFLVSVLCGKAWAQPRTYPLAWEASKLSNARIEATSTPYEDTLKLPYFYDFSSRYLQIDHITSGSSVVVYTQRPHGLKSYDSVYVSGSKAPTVASDVEGKRYVKYINSYQIQLYDSLSLSVAAQTDSPNPIDYLRITKVGAQETIIPDTLAFYYNHGGVQINGGSAKNQPSYYVARFDGLDETGVPYSTSTFATGYTDSLRSQVFDLSGYTAASNIYMSFYYQHGGYGEQPDANDHLYLEFFDTTSTWNVVTDLTGSTSNTDSFFVAITPITDPKYLHSKFQYRFRSYGRQSGSYDVWNLDYIYLNQNRTAADTTIYDFSLRDGETFLKNYKAMPFKHFFTNPGTFVKDSMSLVATNQKLVKKNRSMVLTIEDQYKGLLRTKTLAADTNASHVKTYEFNNLSSGYTYPNPNQALFINQTYSFDDGQREDIGSLFPCDLMFNNFLTKRTYLYDYYAYDDSEAEVAFGTNFAGTQIAYKFVAEIKDTLTHVNISFARSKGPNLENSQIYLMVWKNSLSDGNVVYQQPISIHYPSSANGFVSYPLISSIPLDSLTNYYIGYQQNLSSLLTLGYDRNNDSRTNMYYKESSSWVQMSTDPTIEAGSMMMRPVFYKASNNIPVGVKNPLANKNGLLLYPNPASTHIDIVATEEITALDYTMYSLYGQTVDSGHITSTDHTIDISSLSAGMYLILCTDLEGKIYSTRFIKE